MKNQLVIAFAIGLLLSTSATGQDLPVDIKAKLVEAKEAKATHRVEVVLDIKAGWHTYDQLPEGNPSPSTSVKLALPDGVEAVGDWVRPPSLPDLLSPETLVFEGEAKFSRLVRIENADSLREIGVTVSFQVCNAEKCYPPQNKELKISIPADGQPGSDFEFANPTFRAPIRLMVAGKPMNHFAGKMYPSPSVYDVDKDGKVELVSGDIFGTLMVYENSNDDEKSDPVWEKPEPLKSKDGEDIKVKNW